MASNLCVRLSSGRVPLQQKELCGMKQSEVDGIAAFLDSKMPSLSDGQAYSLSELHSQYLEACVSVGAAHLPLNSLKLVLVNAFQSHVQVIADASNTLQIVLLKTLNVIDELNELAFLRKAVRNSETKLRKCPLSSTLSSFYPSAVLLHKFLEEINSSQSERADAPRFNREVKFTHKKLPRGSQKLNNTVNNTNNVRNGSFAYKGLCVAYESLCNFLHILIKGCCPEDNQEFMDSALFGEIARLVEELARLQLLYRQPPQAAPQTVSGVEVVYNGCKHTLPPLPREVSMEHLHQLIKTRLSLAKDSNLSVSFHDNSLKKNVPLNSDNIKCVHGKTLLVEMRDQDSSHGAYLLMETSEATTCNEIPFEASVMVGSSNEQLQNTFVNRHEDDDNDNSHTQSLDHVNDHDDDDDNGHTQSLNHCDSNDKIEVSSIAALQCEEDFHHRSTSGVVDEEMRLDKVDGQCQPCYSATEKERCPGMTSPPLLLPLDSFPPLLVTPHLPLDAFPPTLVARISRHEPLLRAELCEVTSTVFRHVVPAVPYPTRNQYCEIIKALFRTLPGLLSYSCSYEDAFAEWKYRLSHKFRNCRRKKKRTSKRPRPTDAYGIETYRSHRSPCIATPVIKAVLLHKNKHHNLTLNMEEPLSLDSLLGLIHRQLDIPQYVALRVLLQDGGDLAPVTQHNVHLVSGKHLVVEIDDTIDISHISMDTDSLQHEDDENVSGKEHNVDLVTEKRLVVDMDDNINLPTIPVDAILRDEDGKNVSVKQHNVDLVSGKHLVVEIDDNIDCNIDPPQIPVDATLSHENGKNEEASVKSESCHLLIPMDADILRHEDGKNEDVPVKFEPGLAEEEENGSKENESGGISIPPSLHAQDSDTLHTTCKPDLSPSTRMEIEEDYLKVEVDKSEEIDIGKTYLDFDAIESCGLVQHEVMNFKTEESRHFSADHRDHLLQEIVFFEDFENKNPRPARKKRRYRCRGAPLPPNFSVPLSVFPPLLTARVAHRLPLARSDVCRITSALFCYVVTQLPYPTPTQYSEIICALFAALPGLLSYSDCVEAAHSEWKYRLSHKYRNYRRKKKNNKFQSHTKRGRRTSFADDDPQPTDEFPHGDAALSLWANDSVFPFGSSNKKAVCGGASPTCGLPSQ